uniref:Uncharacterized protein n=1 Tax=Anguilla anguilla TaxID=7936 RepID=A0A0E9PP48_ANGAN
MSPKCLLRSLLSKYMKMWQD